MNIVVKSALSAAALVLAYACATPVEIADDVLRANPSDFGDGGLPPSGTGGAGAGGGAPQGGTGSGTGGSSLPAGGTGAGVGGASAGAGMQASAGAAVLPVGTGGTGAGIGGGTAQGGTGGAAGGSGSGGAAGTIGAAGTPGTAGAAGTGATGTVDATQCDFDDLAGCEALICQTVCPTNDGGSCLTRCNSVIACVSGEEAANPGASCITPEDPLCSARVQGQPKACTAVVESAGGADPTPPSGTGNPSPAFAARQLVQCLCSVPRP